MGMTIGSSLLASVQAVLDKPASLLNTLSGSLANTSTHFICFLVIQTCMPLTMGHLTRLVPTVLTATKLRLKLADADAPADEPALYHVLWSQVVYAVTIGICYASIAPMSTIFVLVYLWLARLLLKRNLLFSLTHKAESRGAFFPAGSSMLVMLLAVAQVLLAAVHAAKQSWATFACLLPPFLLAQVAGKYCKRVLAPQLETLPLAGRRRHHDVPSGAPSPSAVQDIQMRFVARLMNRGGAGSQGSKASGEAEPLSSRFASYYVQPELLHEAVVGEAAANAHRHTIAGYRPSVAGFRPSAASGSRPSMVASGRLGSTRAHDAKIAPAAWPVETEAAAEEGEEDVEDEDEGKPQKQTLLRFWQSFSD